MNTDKLMELERKWRKRGDDVCLNIQARAANAMCADELAAALRAEQAVGEEQIARELLRHEFAMSDVTTAAMRRMDADNMTEVEQAAIRAIRRALGAARQSEGVVLVPREPTLDMKRAGSYAVSCLTHDGAMVCYRAMLAAAPGGEGEG